MLELGLLSETILKVKLVAKLLTYHMNVLLRINLAISLNLKVIYHPLHGMNNFVTNKSKLPQDGAQVSPYLVWLAVMWPSERVTPYKDIIIHTI